MSNSYKTEIWIDLVNDQNMSNGFITETWIDLVDDEDIIKESEEEFENIPNLENELTWDEEISDLENEDQKVMYYRWYDLNWEREECLICNEELKKYIVLKEIK